MKSKQYVASISILILSYICYKYINITDLQNIIAQTCNALRNFTGQTDLGHHHQDGPLKLDLATIDMTAAKTNSRKAADQIYKALKDAGFAYLINIPGFDADKLLESTKYLFSLPLESKMKLAKKAFRQTNSNSFRGYFPVIPGGHSYKEAFEIGSVFEKRRETKNEPKENARRLMRDVLLEENVWPSTNNTNKDIEFEVFMQQYYYFCKEIAKELMHLMAEGLNLRQDYFDRMFGDNQLSTLRLLHYPTRINHTDVPEEAKDGDTLITTGEHFDTSFLTILATFENRGLQVKLDENGAWLDVPPLKNGLIINIGKLLSNMVNGKFKATNHRVIDLGTDRYSVPFFYEPHFDGDISRAINGEIINSVYPKYGPWMTNRTSQFAEYATTDFGIAD